MKSLIEIRSVEKISEYIQKLKSWNYTDDEIFEYLIEKRFGEWE